jgi:hypothetical protein
MLVMLAILLAPVPASANADLHQLADQAIALSGTPVYVAGVSATFDKQLADDPRLAQLKPEDRAKLTTRLRAVFDPRQVLTDLGTALTASGDASQLDAAIAAMRDPVYQKINLALIHGNADLTEAQISAYAASLENSAPDPARVGLVRALDDATDSSRIGADTRYALAKAMLDKDAGADQRDTLDSMRTQYDSAARNNFLVRTLLLSAKLDPAEFESYVRINQQDAMRWLSKQLGYATQRAITHAIQTMQQIENAATK